VECYIAEDYMFILKNHKLSLSMQLRYGYPDKARDYALWLAEIEDTVLSLYKAASDTYTTVTLSPNTFIDIQELVTVGFRLLLLLIPLDDLLSRLLNGDVNRIRADYCNTLKNVLS